MTYAEMFVEIAQKYALDWRLLAEQAWVESRLNPLAVGKANDMGLLQIIPSTWDEWAPRIGVADPFDAYSNVLVAAVYLDFLRGYLLRFGLGEYYWVLVAYNWGPGNVRRLMESGGGWLDLPAVRREYAVTIVLQADMYGLLQAQTSGLATRGGAGLAGGSVPIHLDQLLAAPLLTSQSTPPSARSRAN